MSRSDLLVPLVLTAVLAAALGFVLGRGLAATEAPKVAVLPVQVTETVPGPEVVIEDEDEEEDEDEGEDEDRPPSDRGPGRDPRCPRGCECTFTEESHVIICQR